MESRHEPPSSPSPGKRGRESSLRLRAIIESDYSADKPQSARTASVARGTKAALVGVPTCDDYSVAAASFPMIKEPLRSSID